MSGTNGSKSTCTALLRSALVLVCALMTAALLLMPFAIVRAGSGGPNGLLLALAVCLVTGLATEVLGSALHDRVAPLVLMLVGMTIRIVPPLGVCVFLAAQGHDGRGHLAFIVYLLAFYLVTLALETWLTVSRVANAGTAKSRPIAE